MSKTRIEKPPTLGYHLPSIKNGLGRRLRELRESQMLYRSTAAKMAGISRSHLYDIERRGIMPRIDVLIKLANLYGVAVAYLCFDSPPHEAIPNPLTEFSEGRRFR